MKLKHHGCTRNCNGAAASIAADNSPAGSCLCPAGLRIISALARSRLIAHCGSVVIRADGSTAARIMRSLRHHVDVYVGVYVCGCVRVCQCQSYIYAAQSHTASLLR